MILLADVMHSLPSAADLGRYVLLAAGLGFVVFFHELGHFLAAKYCRVRVDQFAVGFGNAIFSWRKGIGFRKGSTWPEAEARLEEYDKQHNKLSDQPADQPLTSQQSERGLEALGIGETEYRLNWIPLGGYVKMLGQDDMATEAAGDDPRSYQNRPIRSRMLIVSAGVLMNVLLAAIGFMIVFLMGFHTPPAEVGGVLAGSPASFAMTDNGTLAPLQVGDHILQLDGKTQQDFGKLALTVALVHEGESIPMVVRRRDGQVQTLHVTPMRTAGDSAGLLSLGILPPLDLRGPDVTEQVDPAFSNPDLFPAEVRDLHPGDVITAINGQAVDSSPQADDQWMLNRAVADSDGKPVTLTVKSADGSTHSLSVWPHFSGPFSADDDLSFAGMTPRARVDELMSDSPAVGQLHPGDAFVSIAEPPDGPALENPSAKTLRDAVNNAGQRGQPIVLTVLDSSGATHTTKPIVPDVKLSDDRRGLSILLGCDEQNTVVGTVAPDSSAAKAGIQSGWRITSVAGQPVSNWFQVRSILSAATPGEPLKIEAMTPSGPTTVSLSPGRDDIDAAKYMTFTTDLSSMLHEREEVRKTRNPIIAARWGAAETRDFILQFYVTLRRMIGGSVSYKQAMGPVGIVRFGAMSAARGADWLVWFLSMISANLAVANFLPIPVMDGGLFVLLILEGVQGRPLSLKTQQVIQMVGLAIILSIFLLVTYQDITRTLGHG